MRERYLSTGMVCAKCIIHTTYLIDDICLSCYNNLIHQEHGNVRNKISQKILDYCKPKKAPTMKPPKDN